MILHAFLLQIIYTTLRVDCLGFKHIYSQLHIKGIEQRTTPIQALSFLHVQGIHSVKGI